MWNEKLSHDYDGKRFVVDGDIIELYAYEYGACQTDVAKQFHAEPLEAYESEWLHDWTEHHDNMLRRTCDALESENVKLRELVLGYAKIANYFCEREGYCSHDFVAQCRYYRPQQCRLGELGDKLHELGIEVE